MPSRANSTRESKIRRIYRRLGRAWGLQHWWPAQSPFEVIAGAILTQNTSWTNVERVLEKLRQANRLSVDGIRKLPLADLEQLVQSSGYYRQKAARLKSFVCFLDENYHGSLEKMFATPTEQLRVELLSLHGIGPETADAILLYGGKHEIFVVDAYTRRIFERHELVDSRAAYDEIRTLVEQALLREPPTTPSGISRNLTSRKAIVIHEPSFMSQSQGTCLSQVYNEMHALLVQAGKHYCYKLHPDCHECPLKSLLPVK